MEKVIKAISTLFYLGELKKAPGTFASLFSFIVFWFVYTGTYLNFSIFLVFSVLSIFICDQAEVVFKSKDDQRIVLDEFVGSFFSIILLPKNVWFYLFAFILFRIFDIVKPLFIKKSQKLRGGLGIVLDDILAGMLTTLTMVIAMLIFYKK
ncbi:MAG: phosphatidylglycerophosphatase A [bacterium]|nr:phosphatidylglycerophosphatase A [bacterium]